MGRVQLSERVVGTYPQKRDSSQDSQHLLESWKMEEYERLCWGLSLHAPELCGELQAGKEDWERLTHLTSFPPYTAAEH